MASEPLVFRCGNTRITLMENYEARSRLRKNQYLGLVSFSLLSLFSSIGFQLRSFMAMRCAFDSFLFRGNRFPRHQAHYCLHRHKFPHSYQVVSRSGEDKDPVHPRGAAMAQFAQQAHRLQPAEDLFDPFALLLTDLITAVSGGA